MWGKLFDRVVHVSTPCINQVWRNQPRGEHDKEIRVTGQMELYREVEMVSMMLPNCS
jgi:dephospho-CoA kinase